MGCITTTLIACGVLYVACKFSSVINFYVRWTLFYIFSVFVATAFVPFMLHRVKDSRNALLPSWTLRLLARLFLGLTYEVRGLENVVPQGQGGVVFVNHQSFLDLIVLAYLWPHIPRGCMIAKKELFYVIPFGPATWLWGTEFVDRVNPEKGKEKLNQTGQLITTKKSRIVMFPEGTRHMGPKLLPLKKGGFHIALDAQCHIQPIVVSRYRHLDNKAKRFQSAHNIIEILPAISMKGHSKTEIPVLMEKTWSAMEVAYERISEENDKNNHYKIS